MYLIQKQDSVIHVQFESALVNPGKPAHLSKLLVLLVSVKPKLLIQLDTSGITQIPSWFFSPIPHMLTPKQLLSSGVHLSDCPLAGCKTDTGDSVLTTTLQRFRQNTPCQSLQLKTAQRRFDRPVMKFTM